MRVKNIQTLKIASASMFHSDLFSLVRKLLVVREEVETSLNN